MNDHHTAHELDQLFAERIQAALAERFGLPYSTELGDTLTELWIRNRIQPIPSARLGAPVRIATLREREDFPDGSFVVTTYYNVGAPDVAEYHPPR